MSVKGQRGFTIVEVLVVAPIFILVLMTMLGYLIDRYGDIVVKAKEANLVSEGQAMLITMEDELLFADDYLDTLSSNLNDPFAPSGGWNANTTPSTLIIAETALDSDRRDPNRDFIYTLSSGCTQIAIDNLIYFTQDNSYDSYKTLYKRTIVPTYPTCGTNYKTMSCPAADVGTNGCVKADGIISNKVVDFKVDYYDESGNLIDLNNGGSPLDGERVKVTLTLGDVGYGQPIQRTFSLNMKKLN